MPGAKATRGGTRGAGGLTDHQLTFKIMGALHIPIYKLTGGLIGHRFGKLTELLLTSTGAKSGLPRTTALNYRADGDNFIIVASKGGHINHPLWYTNLLKNPVC